MAQPHAHPHQHQAHPHHLVPGGPMVNAGTIAVTSQAAAYELDQADGVIDGKYYGREIGVTAPGTYATGPAPAPAPAPRAPVPEARHRPQRFDGVDMSVWRAVMSGAMPPPIEAELLPDILPAGPLPPFGYRPPPFGLPVRRRVLPPAPFAGYPCPIHGPYGHNAFHGFHGYGVPPPPPPPVPGFGYGYGGASQRRYCRQTVSGQPLPCTCDAHGHEHHAHHEKTEVVQQRSAYVEQAPATLDATGWQYANGVGIAGGPYNFNYRPLEYDTTGVSTANIALPGSVHPYAYDGQGVALKAFRSAPY